MLSILKRFALYFNNIFCFLCNIDCIISLCINIINNLTDFIYRIHRLFCKLSDFISNYSKASSCFTGSCSFYWSIERQKISLLCNFINCTNNMCNWLWWIFKFCNFFDNLICYLNCTFRIAFKFLYWCHSAFNDFWCIICNACNLVWIIRYKINLIWKIIHLS